MVDRKEYFKKYRDEHKEQIKKTAIDYYQLNKDKIREQENAKVICDVCGFTGASQHMARHKRSKKCMNHKH